MSYINPGELCEDVGLKVLDENIRLVSALIVM